MRTIIKAIGSDKDLTKRLSKEQHYSTEQFIRDAKRYIKAIKERRVICSIGSVSRSGMSRTIKLIAPEKSKHDRGYYYLNFFAFMRVLGYTPAGNTHYFRINGCGMDMIFDTNYTIIHRLHRLKLVNKKECEKLAQMKLAVI